ncbi:hypothetical protein C8R46DRAFT_1084301 [Mycena filopes]|nr:hypothetical protein C8R46DRAFT_1084301 [Mycena filopes]
MAFAAAANASSHASTSALTVAKREITPAASPFAHLLRSSRFAQYDPEIRKTYYSPKQFVERGYWGLKRPISQRKRNSFITIKQWEARQHYIEWDNAEDQIRFIRRMEELDLRPSGNPRSSWTMQLGPARDNWLVDSEFAPRDWSQVPKADEQVEVPKPKEPENKSGDIPSYALGKGGRGAYGAKAVASFKLPSTPRAPPAVIPNVMSMSPPVFERYLQKLRTLRPAFMAYLDREAAKQLELRAEQAKPQPPGTPPVARDKRPLLAGMTLAQLAQFSDGPYHRVFLAEHNQSEYKSTSKIQPQPHRYGALTYTHPTLLDPIFRTKSKPGIVLTEYSSPRFAKGANPTQTQPTHGQELLVSFAGVVASLKSPDKELLPLFDPEVRRENWPHAVAEMRPIHRNPLELTSVPRVVGSTPQEGLEGVGISLRITNEPGLDDPNRPNPYVPGSRQYIALQGDDGSREDVRGGAGAALGGMEMPQGPLPVSTLKNLPGSATAGFQAQNMGPYDYQQTDAERETTRFALGKLQGILAKSDSSPTVPDEEL